MTGTASLIESSFCYDSGYPWQLVQSWALSLLGAAQGYVFKELLFQPSLESNTGFLQNYIVLNGKLLQWEMWAGDL